MAGIDAILKMVRTSCASDAGFYQGIHVIVSGVRRLSRVMLLASSSSIVW